MNNWHAVKKESVLKKLKTSEDGLDEKEAGIRLERYGKNLIKESDKISKSLLQLIALIFGILVMAALLLLE